MYYHISQLAETFYLCMKESLTISTHSIFKNIFYQIKSNLTQLIFQRVNSINPWSLPLKILIINGQQIFANLSII